MLANVDFGDILDRQISASVKKILLERIVFKEAKHHDEGNQLSKKYKPLNADYKPGKPRQVSTNNNAEVIPKPTVVLYAEENIELKWKQIKRIGPGLANLGNTCFLNSILQVLTYTPPLANYFFTDHHKKKCKSVGFCMQCELHNHILKALRENTNGVIRPMSIIQKLQFIGKHFRFGRQEDSHEFLRYVVEGLQKSDYVGKPNLDKYSKETTVANAIFGGRYRSQVKCLKCHTDSNTYDSMMDLNLDIKNCNTVIQALQKSVRADRLEGDNKYYCERCRVKTVAQKRNSIFQEPNVLTMQLKRFDFSNMFGGKISNKIVFPEELNLRPFMSNPQGVPVFYKLYAVLVHSGYSCNSGHYYCYVKASNNMWYEMNDNRVCQVGLQTVLDAQAYMLFYIRKQPKQNTQTPKQQTTVNQHTVTSNKTNNAPVKVSNLQQQKENNVLGEAKKPSKDILGEAKKPLKDILGDLKKPTTTSIFGEAVARKPASQPKINWNVKKKTTEPIQIILNKKPAQKLNSLQSLNLSYADQGGSSSSNSSGASSPVNKQVILTSFKEKKSPGMEDVKPNDITNSKQEQTEKSSSIENNNKTVKKNISQEESNNKNETKMKTESESDVISDHKDRSQLKLSLNEQRGKRTSPQPHQRSKLFNGKHFDRNGVWSPLTKAALHSRIVVNKLSSDGSSRSNSNRSSPDISQTVADISQTVPLNSPQLVLNTPADIKEKLIGSVKKEDEKKDKLSCIRASNEELANTEKYQSLITELSVKRKLSTHQTEESTFKKKKHKKEKKKKKRRRNNSDENVEGDWIERKRKHDVANNDVIEDDVVKKKKKPKDVDYTSSVDDPEENSKREKLAKKKKKKEKKHKRKHTNSEDDTLDSDGIFPRRRNDDGLNSSYDIKLPPEHMKKKEVRSFAWDDEKKVKTNSWSGTMDVKLKYLEKTKTKVCSWNGEDRSANFTVTGISDSRQDDWDEEYDKGKVKKVKTKSEDRKSQHGKHNEFQTLQDYRNQTKDASATLKQPHSKHHSNKHKTTHLQDSVKKFL